ncbi:bifunctional transcriptional activator/DNA repair enzyme AdaA [Bacillus sp. AFS041924]|uniref:bifunctional transcriptional activator/DNA repair enzyme AdaA n=1 Tax=Bacillus sp. AFS041924 TaxID=2033503 RepID=UPI000BFBC7D9|nr:Ada metal-binding domain-containing protein [Bacillus sp. AFS041924]PGS56296.1 AraC family transcriptional regulator [Bacillus sp. AFS041924]
MDGLNNQVMWTAVEKCDENYDGVFIYAVQSTGICCKPSCKSRTPLKENVSFYSSFSLAIDDGYRPCKRCRPDLLHSNEEDIILSAKRFIEKEYRSNLTLDRLAIEVGVSKFHLQRLFKKSTGISPLEYATKLKMKEATRLLQVTDDTITEIAYGLGFKSSAHFASLFRQQLNYTPTTFRKGLNK